MLQIRIMVLLSLKGQCHKIFYIFQLWIEPTKAHDQ